MMRWGIMAYYSWSPERARKKSVVLAYVYAYLFLGVFVWFLNMFYICFLSCVFIIYNSWCSLVYCVNIVVHNLSVLVFVLVCLLIIGSYFVLSTWVRLLIFAYFLLIFAYFCLFLLIVAYFLIIFAYLCLFLFISAYCCLFLLIFAYCRFSLSYFVLLCLHLF